MGHPKKQRRKYENPFRPYSKARIEREKKIMKEFGLRRKRELRRSEALLRNLRRRARALQAFENKEEEKKLMQTVKKLGLGDVRKLEDVLGLNIEHILSRRLQTIVYKKGIASTIKHARQLIVHGHIFLGNRKTVWPSQLLEIDKENNIKYRGVEA